MLTDHGLLRREDGRWVGTTDLSDVMVPPSIQAILAARLDLLSPEERAVIERASVVGKVFYRGAILELSPEGERPGVGSHLMTLARKDLIRPDRSDLAGEDAFRFRHLLIRDAAYESMPKETRADLHERLAGWLEGASGEHRTEFEEIVGYHLEQSYRYRSELGPVDDRDRTLGARAAARLAAAGRRAYGRGDISATVKLLTRAAELLPGDPGRLELLPDLGAALSEAGDFARAEAVLSELIEGARENGARALESHGLLGRLNLLLMTDPEGRTEEARREAERAIEVFEEVGDERGLARAWDLVAMTHWIGARAAAAGEAAERAIIHARRAGDQRRSDSMWMLPMGTMFGPAPTADAIQRCLEILERADSDRTMEAFALVALGEGHAMQGRFEEGRESVARGRAILLDLGLKVHAAAGGHVAGTVEMLAGDLAEAERVLRESYDELERLGERSYNSTTAAYLAEATYLRGDHAEAERFSRISEETAATDDIPSQVGWRGPRAKVLAGRGSLDEAEALAREGVTLAERTDDIDTQGDALMDLAEVLILAGRPEEAVPSVKKAVELYERKGNVVSARRARTVLTELGTG